MKLRLLSLVVLSGISAYGQEAAPATAYVPDKTCPFMREAQDPSTEKLLKSVTDTVQALVKNCDPKLQTPLAALKKSLLQLGADSGVDRFATPGPETKGYLGVGVSCANYPDVLRAEFEAALAAAHAGSREFPSDDYKKCLATADAAGCTRGRYLDKMRDQRHRCTMNRENEKWVQQRQRYETLAEELAGSLNAVVTGADSCKGGAGPVLEMALQGLGLFATLSPAFGPYGMGVALGADVLHTIVARMRPAQRNARANEAMKRRAQLDRLACLYLDSLNATVDCPSRLNDLRERIVKASAQGQAVAATAVPGPPAQTIELLAKINQVQATFNQIKAAKDDRTKLSRLLSDLHTLLDKTPVMVPAPKGDQASFQQAATLREFLSGSGNWLTAFSRSKMPRSDDVFFAREVERQGRQVQSTLTAYEKLLDQSIPPDKVDAALQAFLKSLEGGGDKKEPALDVEEALSHMLDYYPPSYAFREAATSRLLNSTAPKTRPSTAGAQDKLVAAFSSLVNQMQSSADEFFDDTSAKPQLKADVRQSTVTQRSQTFDSNIQPLFRSCSLMAGLIYYQAEIGGRRTPLTHIRGGKDQGMQFKWPFAADVFPTACKPFFCDSIDRGVLPFHAIDPNRPEIFHEVQCWAMHSYEARLASARRNYVTTGDSCTPPQEGRPPAAPPAPVQGQPVHKPGPAATLGRPRGLDEPPRGPEK